MYNISRFHNLALINMKLLLSFDELVLHKIVCIDPEQSKNVDWFELSKRFPNVIKEDSIYLLYDQLSDWLIDREILLKLKLFYVSN